MPDSFWGKAAGSLWQPLLAGTLASFLGGICVFWLGRRLGHDRLEKAHWLHLTQKRLEWPEHFFKRHGAKTVLLARFVPVLPTVVANLLEGTTTISWSTFQWLNLAGSAAYTIVYIVLGYFFGKKWQLLQAWLGTTARYSIIAGIAVIAIGLMFRNSILLLVERGSPKRPR